MSPLQRKAITEAKELTDDVIGILESIGKEGHTAGLVTAGVKLAKASGWLDTALGGEKNGGAKEGKKAKGA